MTKIVVSRKAKKKKAEKISYRTRPFTMFEEKLNQMTVKQLVKYLCPPIDWRKVQLVLEEKKNIRISDRQAQKTAWRLMQKPEYLEKKRDAEEAAEFAFNMKKHRGLTVSEALALYLLSDIMTAKIMKKKGVKDDRDLTEKDEEEICRETWIFFYNNWEDAMQALELSRSGLHKAEEIKTYQDRMVS